MLSQLNHERISKAIFEDIVDYKKDDTAVTKTDRNLVTKRGERMLRQTTIGWKCLVACKGRTESWI